MSALTFKRLEEMTEANLRLVSENAKLRAALATQPKPTSFEKWFNDQPKPATDPWKEIEVAEKYLKGKYQMTKPAGEWTVDRIRKHLADDPIYGYATLARDINAALAATVHYWQGVATQEWHKGFAASHDEHQKQLAAEQWRATAAERNWKQSLNNLENSATVIQQLRDQLAAAQKKWEQENALHLQAVSYYGESQKALAAERELRKHWEQQCEQLHTQLATEKEKLRELQGPDAVGAKVK